MIFYFDSINGRDSDDGHTLDTAKKTMVEIERVIHPGDTIYIVALDGSSMIKGTWTIKQKISLIGQHFFYDRDIYKVLKGV